MDPTTLPVLQYIILSITFLLLSFAIYDITTHVQGIKASQASDQAAEEKEARLALLKSHGQIYQTSQGGRPNANLQRQHSNIRSRMKGSTSASVSPAKAITQSSNEVENENAHEQDTPSNLKLIVSTEQFACPNPNCVNKRPDLLSENRGNICRQCEIAFCDDGSKGRH